MNYLITGGAGFIGSHLVDRLLKENGRGSKIIVIDDFSEGKRTNLPKDPRLRVCEASILGDIGHLFKNIDVVFHLAALPRLQRSIDEPWKTHEVNVDGTVKLLLYAKKYKVKRFIFASSSSVYGNKNKIPFTEDMRPDPLVPYSLHKVMGEEYCRLFWRLWGLETFCLRYFNVYGPRMNPHSPYANLIPKFIKFMSRNIRPTINGDGKQTRDFTFVSDIVEASLLAAQSSLSGEIFNIGSGKNISVNKVVEILNRLMGKNIKPIHGPKVVEPRATLASCVKARKILGWEPKVKFEEGVKTMLYGYI